jgi:putative ABC transport system permease protein
LTKYKSILAKFMAAFAQLENGGTSSEEDSDSPFADMMANMMNFNTWSEAIDNEELIKSQYDLVGGRWADFSNPNDVLLVLDSYNQIPDYALPEMGLMHEDELILAALVNMAKLNAPENVPEGVLKAEVLKRLNGLVQDVEPSDKNIKINDLLGMEFNITLPYEKYGNDVNNDGVFNEQFNLDFISNRKIKIVGVVRPKEGATGLALTSTLVYTKAFTDSLLRDLENAPIIVAQKANKKIDYFFVE